MQSQPSDSNLPKTDQRPRRAALLSNTFGLWLTFALIFISILLLHLPLLQLPYFWDEAGYFVPAARDLLLLGDFIPTNTLSNAHPPLVMAYLAISWKLFGEDFLTTRIAMSLIAASMLLALFQLARRIANTEVAIAAVICTMLYPVFFAQSTLAHLDMAAAMFTLWGLVLYLPPQNKQDTTGGEQARGSFTQRLLCTALFALAAMAKETAILTPFVLIGWELLGRLAELWRKRSKRLMLYLSLPQPFSFTLLLSLSALPLALWFAYHYSRTGYVFGNPEFFRYNVETTLAPGRILLVMLNRLWHVTGHMNLFVLTLATAWATMRRLPLRDDGVERETIAAPTKVILVLVILAHVVALSLVGGAVLARYMLPVVPLAILLYTNALWRRVRRWREIIGVVCLAFAIGLFVNPPHRFPWEENLAYRDYVLLHKDAAAFISNRHTDARVLTMWTATDELMKPHLGYVPRAILVVPVEHFSTEQLQAVISRGTPFDTVLLFSTNYYNDLRPEQAAALLNADIIYSQSRHGQWIAVLEGKATGK